MFQNFLKIAWRTLKRQKGFTIINLAGLTIGLTGCLLMGLFVWDELQFDKFHKDGDRIFRIYDRVTNSQGTSSVAVTSPVFATVLGNEFPEVENTLRMMNIYSKNLFEKDEEKFYEDHGILADSNFFKFFTLPFSYGNPSTALNHPSGVVLTSKLAEKYFGRGNPVGKIITINKDKFQVSGVIREIPKHFHLNISYVVPMSYGQQFWDQGRMESWNWQQFFTYVKLKEHADLHSIEPKFQEIIRQRAHPVTGKTGFTYIPHFQALKDIHLQSAGFAWDIIVPGNINYVKGLILIALFVLVIACFNFINLATAKSVQRAKEVGIRKTIGAERSQLILQFMGESILISLAAIMIAVLLTYLILPSLNHFTGKEIIFNPFADSGLAAILLSLGIGVGMLSGFYPAVMMSGFNPINILKGIHFKEYAYLNWLRKGLVVVQFALSVLLIVCASIVYRQVNYMHSKDLGFNKEQILYFPLQGENMTRNQESFKNELMQQPGIKSVTIGYGLPGDIVSGDDIIVPGKGGGKTYPARQFLVDYDYIKTMDLKVIAGRDFSMDYSTDKDEGFIINETAVRELGFGSPEEAINKPLHWHVWFAASPDSLKIGKVIGVVKDFHFESLHDKVNTAVLQIFPDAAWKVAIKIAATNTTATINHINKVWQKFSPDYPIQYQFLDENFQKMYESEGKLSSLLWIFTLMAIFVGCLGLFGLATFTAEKRIKEIGIRKVLGATVTNLIILLSKDFLKLVMISSLIAFPVAWWAMNHWLQDFAYRITINGGIFLMAGCAALLIALGTVSFQAIRAAIANPVRSLRTE